MGANHVTFDAVLRLTGSAVKTGFGDYSFMPKRCAHDQDLHWRVTVSMSQWEQVVSKGRTFIAVKAKRSMTTLDTSSQGSGVLADPDRRAFSTGDDSYVTAEFFSGGFSGWTQSLRRLSELGYEFRHLLAVDSDEIAAETYARSHGFPTVLSKGNYGLTDEFLPEHIFVQDSILSPEWYHLMSITGFDMVIKSPPCPPWSLASTCEGLYKADGRLTIQSWGLCHLIKPKLVLLENVGNMKQHEQWPLLKRFIEWCGFAIRYARVLNMSDVAPQYRDRLILIASHEDADTQPHLCTGWPKLERHTMESYSNLMPLVEPWKSQCLIDPIVLKQYLDPNLLPKNPNAKANPLKKSRIDVEQYRIRFPQSSFGCVMGNYSFGHLLPSSVLSSFGLFGTLVCRPDALRFMTIPEIIISMTAVMPLWLPNDHRASMRLLGNAISVPHAMIAVCNALAFLTPLSFWEVQDLYKEAISARMTCQNIRWEAKWGGMSFERSDEVAPTMLMHTYQKITMESPVNAFAFHAEKGVVIKDALKLLAEDSMPTTVFLLPGGIHDAKVNLPSRFEVDDCDVRLLANVSCALRTDSGSFSERSNQSSCIIVLTCHGTFALRRDSGMTIQDVLNTLNHQLSIRTTHLVGAFGEKHPPEMICPDAVISLDVEGSSDTLQRFDYIRLDLEDGEIKFFASDAALREFAQLIHETALDQILGALGWTFMISADFLVDRNIGCIRLMQKPGAFSLTHDDLRFCLAIHLFLIRIRNWQEIGREPNIRCRVKLWHAWIWDGLVDPTVSMLRFDQEWERISGWFNVTRPWRYVINNHTVNPEWPLSGYVTEDESGGSHLKIFMIHGLRGGGPAQLCSTSQIRNSETSGNLRDMADFEASNPEAALAYLLGRLVEFPAPIKRADISVFLELEATVLDGLLCIQGSFEKLREFMHLIKVSGTERTLAFAGWMMACHFTAVFEPVHAQIIFFRKPMVASTSMDFLRDFLKAALIYLGMPRPQDDLPDAIKTKIKLHGVAIFHAKLERNFPMQQLLDTWDQASTICDDPSDIRLVSHVGLVNPDLPLRYFGRCGPDDMTVAQVSFMRPTHGGGPTDVNPMNAHDFQIRQRNNLASFLISQGVDITTCVPFIDSLLKGSGPEAIGSILSLKFPGKKWEALLKLASALNIAMPPVVDKVEKARQRVHQKFKNHAK